MLVDKSTIEIFVERLKCEIDEYREQLAPLESGEILIGRREAGGEWEDITSREIVTLKQIILSLEQAIDHDAQRT